MSRPFQSTLNRQNAFLKGVLAIFLLSLVVIGGTAWAQEPGPEREVEVLLKDLEQSLAAAEPDKHKVERAIDGLENLLDKAQSGALIIPEDLRFKALVVLTRAGVRRIKRGPPSEASDATDHLIREEATPDQGRKVVKVGVRTLRRAPVGGQSAVRQAEPKDEDVEPEPPGPKRALARVESPKVKAVAVERVEPATTKVPQRSAKVVKVVKVEAKPKVKAKTKVRRGAKYFVFAWPVKKARITSRFGMRRHPTLKRRKMHKGTDFGGPKGRRVHATGPGRVLKAGRGGGGVGIQVVIEHPGGWVSRYFHLSKVDVKAGSRVRQGQLIGRVGSTGRSTGPHLHFQVEYNGKAINPEAIIGRRSDKVRRPKR